MSSTAYRVPEDSASVQTPPQEREIFTDDTTWTDRVRTFVGDIDRKANACKRIINLEQDGPYGDAEVLSCAADNVETPCAAWSVLVDKLDNIHSHLFKMRDSVVHTMSIEYPFLFLANLLITGIFPMSRIYVALHASLGYIEMTLSSAGVGARRYSLTCKSFRSPSDWNDLYPVLPYWCPVRLAVAECPSFDVSRPKTRRARDGRTQYTYTINFEEAHVSDAFARIADRWPCTINMCTSTGCVKAAFRGRGDGKLVSLDTKTGLDGPQLYT